MSALQQKGINDCITGYHLQDFSKSSTKLKELQWEGKRQGEEEEWVVFQDSRQRERQLQRL